MVKCQLFTAIAVVSALPLITSGEVSAATVSYNFSNAVEPTEISQAGSLGLFDPSLGTLTGVTLTLEGELFSTLTLTNNSLSAQLVIGTALSTLAFTTNVAALQPLLNSAVVNLTGSTGIQSLSPGTTTVFPLSTTSNIVVDAGSILGAFIGIGTFGLTCQSLTGFGLQGGGGNISASQSSSAGCGATIEYTYEASAVPLPSSLPLFASGLAAAGIAALRRNRARRPETT